MRGGGGEGDGGGVLVNSAWCIDRSADSSVNEGAMGKALLYCVIISRRGVSKQHVEALPLA